MGPETRHFFLYFSPPRGAVNYLLANVYRKNSGEKSLWSKVDVYFCDRKRVVSDPFKSLHYYEVLKFFEVKNIQKFKQKY